MGTENDSTHLDSLARTGEVPPILASPVVVERHFLTPESRSGNVSLH